VNNLAYRPVQNKRKNNPLGEKSMSINQSIKEDFQKENTHKNPQPVEKWKILNKN